MSELIYLVGQISPKFEETYRWRENIIDVFRDRDDINFINPCANKFNSDILNARQFHVNGDKRIKGVDVLPPKDYTYCKRSTMAVVNMNHYDKDKPMLGSYFELGWYYTMPEKTIIGIADELDNYQVQHPFVQQTVDVWCKNEYEVAEIIEYFFTLHLRRR